MNHIVYISSPESYQLEVWKLLEDGQLFLIQIIKLDGEVQPIAILKSKNFLYAGIRPNFSLITYQINNDGTLKEINRTILFGPPNYILIDKKEKFLFCCSYGSNSLSIFKIDRFGIPSNLLMVIKNIIGCHSAMVTYDTQSLFVTSLKKDLIYYFLIKKNHFFLNPKQPYLRSMINSGPRHIILNKPNTIIYSLNEINSSIDVWNLDQENNLAKLIQNIEIADKNFQGIKWASEIRISPSEKHIYALDRSANVVTLYLINKKTNLLTKIASITTEEQPRSFDIDTSGKYLIIAGQISHHITVYKISSTNGTIKKIYRYKTGKGPLWVLIHSLKK